MYIKAGLAVALAGIIAAAAGDAQARDKKFSCPMDKGVTCMSAEDVYEATNHVDYLVPQETGRRARARRSREVAAPTQTVYVQPAIPVAQPAPVVPVGGKAVPTPDRCCDPVATAVSVRGDTLAVSSPIVTSQPAAAAAATAQAVSSSVASTSPSVVLPGGGGQTVLRTTNNEAFRSPAQVMRILIHPWVDDAGDLNMGGYVLTEIEPRRWSVGTNVDATDQGFRLLMSSPVRETAQDARTETGTATPGTGRPERDVALSNSPEKSQ